MPLKSVKLYSSGAVKQSVEVNRSGVIKIFTVRCIFQSTCEQRESKIKKELKKAAKVRLNCYDHAQLILCFRSPLHTNFGCSDALHMENFEN
jgi:hypothetical protein